MSTLTNSVKHRILHVIPTMDRAGAEKQLCLLAAGLPRDEFDVHVCLLTRGGPLLGRLEAASIDTELLGKRWKLDPLAWWRLVRLIRKLEPAIVHTWLFAANSYGRTAAWAAGARKIVATERCVDQWKQWHELALDRHLAGFTERIVVNSSGVRDFYAAHRLPSEKFVLIANGIEEALPSRYTREQLLSELELPPEGRLIGAVGRLWPQKRIEDLIWAADLLKVIRSDLHLLIIGDGPQRKRLERFRHLVRIENQVHFLGERDDVADLMPHFDLLWLASGYEGQPNSVLEAMAAGIPVVATDIPGNRDLVVPDETGFLVPLGDRASFARKAKLLLDDPELRARFGAAGQCRVREHFSVERMVDAHANLYRRLLA